MENDTSTNVRFAEVDTTQKPKSYIDLGNVKIYFTKSFNAFHRKLLKLLLGIDIKKI